MSSLFYDELQEGMRFETSGATVTEDVIIRFAMEWDFQPFHVDALASKSTIFGGLVASGLQTWALTFRLCKEAGVFGINAVAGLGMDKLHWVAPVRPGDTLRATAAVVEKRLSASRPTVGVVKWRVETFNQEERIVLTTFLYNLINVAPKKNV